MENIARITRELLQAKEVLVRYLDDDQNLHLLDLVSKEIIRTIQAGGKIICCGNGGSHADAMHFAEELTGRFREDRKPIAALAISDPTHLSCVSNDYGYEETFARFVQALGKPEDLLVGISTSGNSKNVIRAFERAAMLDMKTLALTGNDGGQLGKMATHEIRVPHVGYSDRIQEMHIKIIHILILLVEQGLDGHTDEEE